MYYVIIARNIAGYNSVLFTVSVSGVYNEKVIIGFNAESEQCTRYC